MKNTSELLEPYPFLYVNSHVLNQNKVPYFQFLTKSNTNNIKQKQNQNQNQNYYTIKNNSSIYYLHSKLSNNKIKQNKNQNKFVDAFIFYNELDLLHFRFRELDSLVSYFILVESAFTFTGKTKPLFFNENKNDFLPYASKIIHVILIDESTIVVLDGFTKFQDSLIINNNKTYHLIDLFDSTFFSNYEFETNLKKDFDYFDHIKNEITKSYKFNYNINDNAKDNNDSDKKKIWDREFLQRDCIDYGIQYLLQENLLKPNDILIISDIDEVVCKETMLDTIVQVGSIQTVFLLHFDYYYYSLQHRLSRIWFFPRAVNLYFYLQTGLKPNILRHTCHYSYYLAIRNSGWHLSYFGNLHFIKNKIENFSHQEYNTKEFTSSENIKKAILKGNDLFTRNEKENGTLCIVNKINPFQNIQYITSFDQQHYKKETKKILNEENNRIIDSKLSHYHEKVNHILKFCDNDKSNQLTYIKNLSTSIKNDFIQNNFDFLPDHSYLLSCSFFQNKWIKLIPQKLILEYYLSFNQEKQEKDNTDELYFTTFGTKENYHHCTQLFIKHFVHFENKQLIFIQNTQSLRFLFGDPMPNFIKTLNIYTVKQDYEDKFQSLSSNSFINHFLYPIRPRARFKIPESNKNYHFNLKEDLFFDPKLSFVDNLFVIRKKDYHLHLKEKNEVKLFVKKFIINNCENNSNDEIIHYLCLNANYGLLPYYLSKYQTKKTITFVTDPKNQWFLSLFIESFKKKQTNENTIYLYDTINCPKTINYYEYVFISNTVNVIENNNENQMNITSCNFTNEQQYIINEALKLNKIKNDYLNSKKHTSDLLSSYHDENLVFAELKDQSLLYLFLKNITNEKNSLIEYILQNQTQNICWMLKLNIYFNEIEISEEMKNYFLNFQFMNYQKELYNNDNYYCLYLFYKKV